MNKFLGLTMTVAFLVGQHAMASAETRLTSPVSGAAAVHQEVTSGSGMVSILHGQVRALKLELASVQGEGSHTPHANTNFQGATNTKIAHLEHQSQTILSQIQLARETANRNAAETRALTDDMMNG
jgi:hypothetical protein